MAKRKRFVGTATGSRLIKDDEIREHRGVKEPIKRERKDVNLPDEKKGREIGKLLPGEKSKDPIKEGYRKSVDRSKLANPRSPDVIWGGDADDPRWNEHDERVRRHKKRSVFDR